MQHYYYEEVTKYQPDVWINKYSYDDCFVVSLFDNLDSQYL